jgi:hypothetical protein
MKERTKDVFTVVMTFAIGCCLGALAMTLFGCGAGPGWLGTGLLVEALLDPSETPEQGLDCWDTNANGECDEEEDTDGDGYCTAIDCQGISGSDGADGADSTVPGPQGPRGITPPPVVIVIPPGVQTGEPGDNSPGGDPPYGNAYGHDNPPGNSHKPDKDDEP